MLLIALQSITTLSYITTAKRPSCVLVAFLVLIFVVVVQNDTTALIHSNNTYKI